MMSSTTTIQQIRAGLSELKDLQSGISTFDWGGTALSSTSPDTGVLPTTNALIERYETARNIYLQRRIDKFLVEQVAAYEDGSKPFDAPTTEHGSEVEVKERHAQALAKLQTVVEAIQVQSGQLRGAYEAVDVRRSELELLLQDWEDGDDDVMGSNSNSNSNDSNDGSSGNIAEEDMETEQQRVEQLQQAKRMLQEKLSRIQDETRQLQDSTRYKRDEIALLQNQIEGERPEDLKNRVEELREMRTFYNSLREVLEELGGAKLANVVEEKENGRLHLTVMLYDEYKVIIEVELHRQSSLRLVHARWAPGQIVRAQSDATPGVGTAGAADTSFHLPLEKLDDLVEIAKSTLGPPHDSRFIIREALARVRITQDRLVDLDALRRHTLTKLVGKDQVVCSLNDGIVVVIRLYENIAQLEQIVGVGGWDEACTNEIFAAVQTDRNATVSSIVEQVQREVGRLKERGINPSTPRLPRRKEGMQM